MAYRYKSRRSARKLAQKSRRNFLISLALIGLLLYATLSWFLLFLVNGVGFLKNTIKPAKKEVVTISQSSLAPPILNIPYEATNTAQIDIKGFGNPNSKVAIFLDDQKKDTVDVSNNGSFEVKNIQLSLGTNNVYGKSIDDSNKESLPSKNFKIIYDNEKPKLDITEPEDGKKITGGDRKIKISGRTEVGVKIFINDSQIIVDKDGAFISDQFLNEGDNNFNIKAIDSAGNSTEIARRVNYQPHE